MPIPLFSHSSFNASVLGRGSVPSAEESGVTISWLLSPAVGVRGKCCEVALRPRRHSNPGLTISKPSLWTGHQPSCAARAAAGIPGTSTFPRVPPAAPGPGESREAPSAAGRRRAVPAGRAGRGRGGAGLRAGPTRGARSPTGFRAPLPAPCAPRRRRHGGLSGRLLPAQLRESRPRRPPPPSAPSSASHFCPFFLQRVSSFSFLQTCLSGPAPRLLAPRVPPLTDFPRPHPGPAGAGDSWCPGIGLPRGRGWGALGRGRGCPGRAPLQGTGATEAQSPGRGWALRPQLAQLGVVLAVLLWSPSRTLSLCGLPVPVPLCRVSFSVSLAICQLVFLSLPVCLSLSICVCLISVRSFVRLSLSEASPSVIVCLDGSLSVRRGLSARPVYQSLCVLSLLRSVWLRLIPGHFPNEPQTLALWAPEPKLGVGRRPPLPL